MPSIEISDFDAHGVTLISAADPDFDGRADAILGGDAAALFDLKPYLAIVYNRNPRTVVAYTVAWTTMQRNGSTEVNYTQFKFPDAVAGTTHGLSMLQGREIRNGGERLVGLGFEAWPPDYLDTYREFGLRATERLGEVRNLRVALDAVIFEDGLMLGPDESRLAEHFIEYVLAKQTMYRDIVVGLENRDVTEDVLAPLRRAVASRQPEPSDPVAKYRKLAAAEVLGFQNRVLIEVFRRALRREAFSIRRSS